LIEIDLKSIVGATYKDGKHSMGVCMGKTNELMNFFGVDRYLACSLVSLDVGYVHIIPL
jgi:hypothetical protein